MTIDELDRLRAHAVSRSLFAPVSLARAIDRLGFVQADPIRAPARAQDLILRHRVTGYRAGDLEQRYAELDVEEDILYAYGFVARRVWRLVHPRRAGRLSALERAVLERVRAGGAVHPRVLEAELGEGARVVNAWGGYSKATKAALERLHDLGLLRVVRRENGVRVYGAPPPARHEIVPAERMRGLILAVADLLQPVPAATLASVMASVRRWLKIGAEPSKVTRELMRAGELELVEAGGVKWLWPAAGGRTSVAEDGVRLLAPFDPLVWDRRRFELFWGWAYRFEAYTPVAKRVRGYYALPLLFGTRVIGWANASVVDGRLDVELGFAGARPRDPAFRRALDVEMARLETFLDVRRRS